MAKKKTQTEEVVMETTPVETPETETTEVMDATATETSEGESTEAKEAAPKKAPRSARGRSRRYQAVRSQVDKTKTYDTFAAVELAKKLSYSKFDGTLVANCVVKDDNMQVVIKFPHSTGKTITVAVVNEDLLKKIEAGTIDFDVLVTEPRFMPQLAKFAKVLGPKGLMPNPKNSTVTANPELKKQELEGGKITLKGEKKAPLMHVTIGKVSADTKALVENIQALQTALRGKLVKLSVSATMSPSIKVMVE